MDWSFEASHPTVIAPASIAATLRSVVIEVSPAVFHRGLAEATKPARAFGDKDFAFLAPLLAQRLLHAKPEHLVVFRVD